MPSGFTLEGTLGSPENAAETLLAVSLAPAGSGRNGILVEACRRLNLYQFEYVVERNQLPALRAISVVGIKNQNALTTFTVVAPKAEWENDKYSAKLRNVANSFKISN